MTLAVEHPRGDQIERQTLTVEEAARDLGIGRGAAYFAAQRGDLPVIRIGRRYVVPRAALERMLDQQIERGTPDGGAARGYYVHGQPGNRAITGKGPDDATAT